MVESRTFPFCDDALALARFKSKLALEDGCWVWTAYRNSKGEKYGRFRWNGKLWLAHRVSFLWSQGFLPERPLEVDHACNNAGCVRPSHLQVLTTKDNVLRSRGVCAENARKTHCKRGHPFSKWNTIRHADGRRECRQCQQERAAFNYLKRTGRLSQDEKF